MAKKDRSGQDTSTAARTHWVVLYHPAAVKEFEELKDRKVRRSILTAGALLGQLGPKSVEPHSKKIAGAQKLR